jgi:hypothetical protein
MNTSPRTRLARLSGLVLLSLLVVVLAAGAAQAMRDFSAGLGGGEPTVTVASKPLQVPPQALNQGVSTSTSAENATSNGAEPTSAGTPSTTAWIAIGAAVAVLIIALAAWTMIRRRHQLSEPASCALHPEDSLCRAG